MALFAIGVRILNLSLNEIRTLVFVTLVFTGQGVIYLIRERGHFWHSAPSRWMIVASLADLVIVSILATRGILMSPLPPLIVGLVGLACLLYLTALDFLKVAILRHYNLCAVTRSRLRLT